MLWDVERASLIAVLAHPEPFILNSDFSKEGKFLVTEGGGVRLWDAQEGHLLAHIGQGQGGHSYWVGAGPRQLLTMSSANLVIEWHLPRSVEELINTAKDFVGRCLSPAEAKSYYIEAALCDQARVYSPARSAPNIPPVPTSTR